MTKFKSFLIRLGIPFFLLLFLVPVFAQEKGGPANEIEKQLEKIPTAPENEIRLAQTVLSISKHREPSLDLGSLEAELDRLTDSVHHRLTGVSDAKDIVNILRKTIHQDAGYRYTEQVDARGIPLNPAELFLHGLLSTKRGYCMNLSLLYLIVAERLDLPLFGVALPNHFFVRYQSGKDRINIEATESGRTYPDSFYRRRFGVGSSENSFFMENLDKRQTLGAYFSNVGMAYYQDTRPPEAIFYLSLATRINPRSIEAQNNLANMYSDLKDWDKAIHHYHLGLKADPANLSTLFNLGLAYKGTGKKQEAIDTLLQAVQIDPFFAPAHQTLVNLYSEENRPYSALLHLKKLIAIDPGNLQLQIALARMFLETNQAKLALQKLKQLRTRHPEHPEILEALAETHYRLNDFDRAIKYYRYLIENNQDNLKAYIQLGWTYYRKGDLRQAAAWTLQGLNQGDGAEPWIRLAHMNLGFYAVLEKNFSKAKDWYLKALSQKNRKAVEGMVGDLQDAKSRLLDRPELDFFSGWVYFKAGQKKKAEKVLTRYLEQDPSGPFAEEARAILDRSSNKVSSNPAVPDPSSRKEPADIPEDMVLIPAGFFIMGSITAGEDERPEHRVYLDDYFIDRYEVPARDFALFLNDVANVKGYYLDNKFGMLYYDGRFHPRKGFESHPVNNVNWKGADAFCRWKKKRLPTEAEWEKAARGTDQRKFPWGNKPPDPARVRYFQTWTEELKHGVMVPVDSMPEGKSPYGLHHMSGNVKEWVDDWFDREYYEDSSSQVNPEGPIGGEFKVLRGGSWRDLPGFIYSSFRNNSYPDTRLDDYGFRCAKSITSDPSPKKLTRLEKLPYTTHPMRKKI